LDFKPLLRLDALRSRLVGMRCALGLSARAVRPVSVQAVRTEGP